MITVSLMQGKKELTKSKPITVQEAFDSFKPQLRPWIHATSLYTRMKKGNGTYLHSSGMQFGMFLKFEEVNHE